MIRLDNNKIFYGSLNDEYMVGHYHLDYYDKTLNVVIEFNGDYWHMNPRKIQADRYKHNPEHDGRRNLGT